MSMKWTTVKKLLHLIFWVVVTVVFLFDRRYLIQKIGLGHFMECTMVRLALIISLAYTNLYMLIPRFFNSKRYVVYFILLVISLGLYVTLQNLYDIYLYGFVIGAIKNRNFWYAFPYNFFTTAWYLLLTTAFKLSIDWYAQRKVIRTLQHKIDNIIVKNGDYEYVFLKSGIKKHKTDIASITHIQGLKDYSVIYTLDDKIIVKGSLKSVEGLFPAKRFIRVHKSYLVAADKVVKFGNQDVTLKNGITVPIGRIYKSALEGL
jgi:LytTr DNA-binding domain